jgi:uncharacterized protein DUF4373
MGRKAEPGILYYRMNCGHTRNKKIRLLVNECGSDGYWVWQCILDQAYESKGYFFDYNDQDELEIFASDTCKLSLELVKKIIDCCLRRGLFDKRLYDECGILTSVMMQEIYMDATAERRRKGTETELSEAYLLIIIPENSRNISILPVKKPIVPRNNQIIPRQNTQRRVEESKVEESKVNKSNGVAPAKPPREKKVVKKTEDETEPYWQDLVACWFNFHKANKLDEPSFAGKDPRTFKSLIQLLKKRASKKNQEWTLENATGSLTYFLTLAFKEEWLKNHFTLANLVEQFDAIYQRSLLEKQKKNAPPASSSAPKTFNEEMRYLVARCKEGQLDVRLINPEHFDKLQVNNFIPVGTLDRQPGDTIDDRKRAAVLEFIKTNSKQHDNQP